MKTDLAKIIETSDDVLVDMYNYIVQTFFDLRGKEIKVSEPLLGHFEIQEFETEDDLEDFCSLISDVADTVAAYKAETINPVNDDDIIRLS